MDISISRLNVTEVGMVRYIEGLGAKLKLHELSDRKGPSDREINLCHAKAAHEVSRRIPVLTRCRKRKSRWIYAPISCYTWCVNVEGRSRNHIQSRIRKLAVWLRNLVAVKGDRE